MHACTLVQHFLCQSCILNTLTLQSSISILLYLHYQHTINIKCLMTRIATSLQLRLHGIPIITQRMPYLLCTKQCTLQTNWFTVDFFVQFHHDISMFDSINPLLWNSCALRMRLLKYCYLLTSRRPMDRKANHMGYVASFPGSSQILSCSCGENPWLQDKIWEGPGDEAMGYVYKLSSSK